MVERLPCRYVSIKGPHRGQHCQNLAKPSYAYCLTHLEQLEHGVVLGDLPNHSKQVEVEEAEDDDFESMDRSHQLHGQKNVVSPPRLINVNVNSLRQRGYKNIREWLLDPSHVYIGHDTHISLGKGEIYHLERLKWSNPFFMDQSLSPYQMTESLQEYEKMIRGSSLYHQLHELGDKILGCWCHCYYGHNNNNSKDMCHGEVLVQLYKEKYGKQYYCSMFHETHEKHEQSSIS